MTDDDLWGPDADLFTPKNEVDESSAPEGNDVSDIVQRDGSIVVNNAAKVAAWLRHELGRGKLSGVFARNGELVHTPRQGEDGYVPPKNEHDNDGPAQVRAVDASKLASRCQYTYNIVKVGKDKETGDFTRTEAMFPPHAARVPVDTPDLLPNVRPLHGIVHSPVLRRDGSLLDQPGYDTATGLLFLPEPGLIVPPVPERPNGDRVRSAIGLLDHMLAGFRFASDSDRCNFIGLLVTPVLRALLPPPYKLGAIGAPMPGSGKSLLAATLRIVHGGVFRAEIPDEESELRKQVSTILDVTTGPVVQFDNVTGVLRSSTLAGLLTSAEWDDRSLGSNKLIRAVNDRLWVVTGNNVTLGGDLVRRTVWITIDPGMPNPHLRTGFEIGDLEAWVREHRGELIHALLVLARAWLSAGAPMVVDRSDSYAKWQGSVRGLLRCVGIPGEFDASSTARQEVGADDTEWESFLARIYEVLGDQPWLVADVVRQISTAMHDRAISVDLLPGDLADKHERGYAIGKSLGRWCRNREGRYAGPYAIRKVEDTKAGIVWRVHRWEATAGGLAEAA